MGGTFSRISGYFGASPQTPVLTLEEKGVNLFHAVSRGDLDRVKYWISLGAPVDIEGPLGRTPLMLAIFQNHITCAQELIESGADGNKQDQQGLSPLILAAKSGYVHLIKAFSKEKINVHLKENTGKTAVMVAAIEEKFEAVKALIELGADINQKDKCQTCHPTIHPNFRGLEPLLEKMQKAEQKSSNCTEKECGMTSLVYLLLKKSAEGIRQIVQIGASMENPGGTTPLMLAAGKGFLDCLEVLISLGASINAVNEIEQTALFFAAGNGHKQCLVKLIESGANVDATDVDGGTPFTLAVCGGHLDCAKEIVNQGGSISSLTKERVTPLMLAAQRQKHLVVKWLLEMGADKTAKDIYGCTALTFAKENRDKKCIALLQ